MNVVDTRRGALAGLLALTASVLIWSAPASAQTAPRAAAAPSSVGSGGGQAELGFTGLSQPEGLSVDAAGNAYVADTGNDRVVKLSAGRVQTTVAFTGLSHPRDVVVDAAGNIYASDSGNGRVVKLPAGGGSQVTLPFTGLVSPAGIAVDGAGAVYVVETNAWGATPPNLGRVRKLASGSLVAEEVMSLRNPVGIDVTSDGTIYVTDPFFQRIVVLPPTGPVTYLTSSNFSTPVDVAVNSAGTAYVASRYNNQIVEIPSGGGNGTVLPFRNLLNPQGVAAQGTTDVWASDTLHDRVVQLHGPPAELRVTTDPPVNGDIIVDGITRDAWGLNWVQMPEGDHQVCFGRVVGYTTPACQDVSLSTAGPTTVLGQYLQKGSLRVITDPPVDSRISVTVGESAWISERNNWGLWTDFDPETYTVCFGAVAGYDVPACRVVQVTAGETTTTTGTFTPNPAAPGPPATDVRIRATTDPPVPAEISVAGWTRNTWGLEWMVGPGGSDICFGEVPGFTGPAEPCTTYSVGNGETATFVGHYEAKGYLRVLTSPPVPATISVDGNPANAYGVWVGIAPGKHDVCFGPVPGFITPPCQDDVVVTAPATSTVTGTYVPSP